MSVSVAATTTHQDEADVLNSLRQDIVNLQTTINTLNAKLDADAGVTDTDYATAAAPSAMGTVA